MWEENQRTAWDHTCSIIAAVYNANNLGDPIQPTDIHPLREPETTTFAQIKKELKVPRDERVRG